MVLLLFLICLSMMLVLEYLDDFLALICLPGLLNSMNEAGGIAAYIGLPLPHHTTPYAPNPLSADTQLVH